MMPFALAVMLAGVTAQQSQAALQVSATVAAHCSFIVDTAAAGAASVRATCGTSSLRTLRASTRAGRPVTFAGPQLRAGGDVVFVVSRAESRGDVLVMLDF